MGEWLASPGATPVLASMCIEENMGKYLLNANPVPCSSGVQTSISKHLYI